MSPRRAAVLAAAFALASSATTASAGRVRDDLDLLARDVRELEQLLATERERSELLQAELAELRRLTGADDPGRLSAADLAARLDGLDRDVQVIFENQNESQRRFAVFSDKLDALYRHQAVFGRPPSAAAVAAGEAGDEDMAREEAPAPPRDEVLPEAPPLGGERAADGEAGLLMDPEELYRAARADYGRGDYVLAVEGFEEFVRRFPDSELADNALYWAGECHWAQRDYQQALAAFDSVLQLHPDGDKVADAGLKRGFCLLELNRMADGIIQLQHVKDAHPGTAAARLAREKLESLGLL